VAKTKQNWRLILDAAQALTASGQTPFTRVSVYEWIWRRYPRAEHDRPSLDPIFQGMVDNARGGPPSLGGTPLQRIGRGRYVLAQPGQPNPGQASPLGRHATGHSAAAITAITELQTGPIYRFADWPNDAVPQRAAGVYTIWRGHVLIYVGMSGRGAQAEDLVTRPGRDGKDKARWLWTRLDSHASGRRSGDQFNLYICDRFVVPILTQDQQRDVGRGYLLLDQMTRSFIREHLSYRFAIYSSGEEAFQIERDIRAGGLPAGRPYLNPL
jgi:hypothetical protein